MTVHLQPHADAPPPWRFGWLAGGVLLGATGTTLLHLHDPNAADSPFAPCIFHALTGYWCPSCGITRMLHALVHGDILRALEMNPLAVLLLPVGVLAWAWAGGWRPAWTAPAIRIMAKPLLWAVVVSAYWIARNLPWPPFQWLAPG